VNAPPFRPIIAADGGVPAFFIKDEENHEIQKKKYGTSFFR